MQRRHRTYGEEFFPSVRVYEVYLRRRVFKGCTEVVVPLHHGAVAFQYGDEGEKFHNKAAKVRMEFSKQMPPLSRGSVGQSCGYLGI